MIDRVSRGLLWVGVEAWVWTGVRAYSRSSVVIGATVAMYRGLLSEPSIGLELPATGSGR